MRQRKIIAMKRGSGKSERGGLGNGRGKIITDGNEKNEKKEQKKNETNKTNEKEEDNNNNATTHTKEKRSTGKKMRVSSPTQ